MVTLALPHTYGQVYTDRLGYKGYAGAAALLVRSDGIHNLRRVLGYKLGPLKKHAVYEAEGVGIPLGIHLICTEEHKFAAVPSTISPDKQTVIRATEHAQRCNRATTRRIHFAIPPSTSTITATVTGTPLRSDDIWTRRRGT